MKIVVVGVGYVGLVSGACFAETGAEVVCVDVNKERIEGLLKGVMPIWEPGLADVVERNQAKGRLHFSTDLGKSLVGAEVVFVAVGTPSGSDGSANLSYVMQVAAEIGRHLDHYMVVVTKSTVPVGTSMEIKRTIQQELDKRRCKVPFDVASNPEFLKEGDAIQDFLRPERIVVGTESDRARKVIESLYRPFLLNGFPVVFMDIASSELTKYAANAMLATKISFMNDMANLCELLGADVSLVRKGIGSDSRIGSKFLYAGAGYGGSCFPKDVQAIINTADQHGYSLEVIKAVERVNNKQKEVLYHKVHNYFGGQLQGKRIALWGLAFKPNTDDMREASAVVVARLLLGAGATVVAYDPVAVTEARKHYLGNNVTYAPDAYTALQDADALVLMTEWPEFRMFDYTKARQIMKSPVVFDGRNIFDPVEMREQGFTYDGIGRRK